MSNVLPEASTSAMKLSWEQRVQRAAETNRKRREAQQEIDKARAEEYCKQAPQTPGCAPVRSCFWALSSWYGPGFHGRRTANGEIYDQSGISAAHKTLPFGTVVYVETANGGHLPVRINDRGPYSGSRQFDFSMAAAKQVITESGNTLYNQGVGSVKICQ